MQILLILYPKHVIKLLGYNSECYRDVQFDGHVPSFLTINQLMENEQRRYLSMDVPSCDFSNNPDPEDLNERGIVNYYLTPSPQFENVEDFGNVVLSDWTPWVNYNTTNSSGEFVVS